MPADLVLQAHRAILPDGERAATVVVSAGRIVEVIDGMVDVDRDSAATEQVRLDADCVLLPGLVDSHVHVNEPGRTQWEGFSTATAAAAAGGITTIVDMPLNSIPATVDVAALEVKRQAAAGQLSVDVAFWGGAVPGNLDALQPMHAAGVVGFKCFMLPSGVEEFPPLDASELTAAMTGIASFDGLLIAHAEDQSVIDDAPAPAGRGYRSFVDSRPPEAERSAIALLLDATRRTGCRTHIVHLSAAAALPTIAQAKDEGLPLTVETCPHYLTLAAERVPDGATAYKCCPPIREEANREQLWGALASGLIDLIVSDHSPCTPDLKLLESGDFGGAWGGIASVQLSLPAVWTEASRRGFGLADIARWMASGPAALAGLPAKGRIVSGADADLTVFAPEEAFVVNPADLRHRNKVTPYSGDTLRGVVRRTFLAGRPVDDAEPRGRILRRGAS